MSLRPTYPNRISKNHKSIYKATIRNVQTDRHGPNIYSIYAVLSGVYEK